MAKVSIIVPVYNVEKYLKECLDSLVNQTFKDIKIILVNDCSTDSSGEICKNYLTDERITLINKEKNGGLSRARNTALDVLDTEYVTFVDSDDYVSSDHIENMYNSILENDSDISVCGYEHFTETSTKIVDVMPPNGAKCVGNKDALILFHNRVMKYNVCNKLFKSEVFKDKRFPAGKTMEDVYVVYEAVKEAKKVSFTGTIGYYYRNRDGSIMNSKDKHLMDVLAVDLFKMEMIEKDMEITGDAVNDFYKRVRNTYIKTLMEKLYGKDAVEKDDKLDFYWQEGKKRVKITEPEWWAKTRMPKTYLVYEKIRKKIIGR